MPNHRATATFWDQLCIFDLLFVSPLVFLRLLPEEQTKLHADTAERHQTGLCDGATLLLLQLFSSQHNPKS